MAFASTQRSAVTSAKTTAAAAAVVFALVTAEP